MSALLFALPHLASPAAAEPAGTSAQLLSACYDGAVTGYVTAGSGKAYLPSSTGYYTTSSRCGDINFSNRSYDNQNINAQIRVCFVSAGYCQSTWKHYTSTTGAWMVIASNVADGTRFRLEFTFASNTWGSHYGNLIAY
ncbi:hypothetical protein [Micromonospora sp. NPDC049151]